MNHLLKRVFLSLILLFTITIDAYAADINENQQRNNYKVIVIGAGVAGLAAGNFLTKNHITTLVLEARNRIGGRIFSLYPWGPALELGASWIHGIEANPIGHLVQKHGIKTLPTAYNEKESANKLKDFVFYKADGTKYSNAEVKKLIHIFLQYEEYVLHHSKQLQKASIDNALTVFSKEKHLTEQQVNELQFLLINIYSYEYAADLNQLPSNIESAFTESNVSGKNVIFPHGYIQVIAQLAKEVPIKLNQIVKQIDYHSLSGVDVITQNQRYHADYVILTVPLGVLKSGSISFSPPLPESKQQAINKLGVGVFDKTYLFFDHPFWDKNSEWIGYIPKSHEISVSVDIMNYYKFTQIPILLIFSSGTFASKMENWNDTQIITSIMNTLKKMYGNQIPEPTSYIITRWNNDPFNKGSYSYLPTGSDVNTYKIMADPIDNKLFFAGEATSSADPSTVHGAYLSGIRAAKEVINLSKKDRS